MLTRSAGILIPLFSIRTRDGLGRGEILDLAPMMDFALSMGHRGIQLLPLDETGPDDLSPYSAMSVMAIDPMYISISGLPGVGRVVSARAREAVGKARFVPRAIIRREKFALLERAYRASRARGGQDQSALLDAFIKANSYWLDDYALFRALKERFNWTELGNVAGGNREAGCGGARARAARAGRFDRDVRLLAVRRASAMGRRCVHMRRRTARSSAETSRSRRAATAPRCGRTRPSSI